VLVTAVSPLKATVFKPADDGQQGEKSVWQKVTGRTENLTANVGLYCIVCSF